MPQGRSHARSQTCPQAARKLALPLPVWHKTKARQNMSASNKQKSPSSSFDLIKAIFYCYAGQSPAALFLRNTRLQHFEGGQAPGGAISAKYAPTPVAGLCPAPPPALQYRAKSSMHYRHKIKRPLYSRKRKSGCGAAHCSAKAAPPPNFSQRLSFLRHISAV